MAAVLPAFTSGENESELRWSENALILLERAPVAIDIAKVLIDVIEPTSWMGSRAEAIKQRLPLLDDLARVLGPAHSEQVSLWRGKLVRTIEREARRELDEHRAQDERFE